MAHGCFDLIGLGAARYDWVDRIVAVGIGHRSADVPVYSFFWVL